MYKLLFDKESIDFLNKLQKQVKERIFKKIISSKENPFKSFARLTGRADYKLRVGDYRVIADIDEKTKTIKITLIDHRQNIYKRI